MAPPPGFAMVSNGGFMAAQAPMMMYPQRPVPPPPAMYPMVPGIQGTFTITFESLKDLEQQQAYQRIMQRSFNRDGISGSAQAGANNQIFMKEVQSIQQSEEFKKSDKPSERMEMVAEILLDWVICIANE